MDLELTKIHYNRDTIRILIEGNGTYCNYDKDLNITDSVGLSVKISYQTKQYENGKTEYHYCVFFKGFYPKTNLSQEITLSSKKLSFSNFTLKCDNEINEGEYLLVYKKKSLTSKLNFDASAEIVFPRSNQFATLHQDMSMVDFELRGSDGSIAVHKAVLAASSPVFNTMLSGAWKETSQSHVDLPDATQLALQHFKDYIYTYKLPDTGVEHLLGLASCYMMSELEDICVHKVISAVCVEKSWDILEICAKYKSEKLIEQMVHLFSVATLSKAHVSN